MFHNQIASTGAHLDLFRQRSRLLFPVEDKIIAIRLAGLIKEFKYRLLTPSEHFVGLSVFVLRSSENHLFLYSRLKLVRFSFEVDPKLSWVVV